MNRIIAILPAFFALSTVGGYASRAAGGHTAAASHAAPPAAATYAALPDKAHLFPELFSGKWVGSFPLPEGVSPFEVVHSTVVLNADHTFTVDTVKSTGTWHDRGTYTLQGYRVIFLPTRSAAQTFVLGFTDVRGLELVGFVAGKGKVKPLTYSLTRP